MEKSSRFFQLSLILSILACLSILAFRLFSVLSWQMPMQVVTSGFEEESLFAMWKFVHGEALYQDPHQIPFSASYFNYLFYVTYGTWIRYLLEWFALTDAWIPTVARFFTLLLVSVGFGASFWWFQRLHQSGGRWLSLAMSTLIFYGPLMGFWAVTVRPDPGAFVFEVLAVIGYFILKDRRPNLGLLTFIILTYCAWAFKQINIIFPVAMGLYLIWQRQWKQLIGYCFGLWGLMGLTLYLAPEAMFQALLFAKTDVSLDFSVWQHNFMYLMFKGFPVFGMLLGALIISRSTLSQLMRTNHVFRFCLCGLLAWGLIMLPASAKVGSADNYHFSALFFLSVMMFLWVSQANLTMKTYSAACWLLFLGILLAASQHMTFSVRPLHEYHLRLKACVENLPKPVFVANLYLSLPWMNTSEPHFVLAHNYGWDRANFTFERDGVGGLIEEGFFKGLLLPATTQDEYDGHPLKKYERQEICEDMKQYVLSEFN